MGAMAPGRRRHDILHGAANRRATPDARGCYRLATCLRHPTAACHDFPPFLVCKGMPGQNDHLPCWTVSLTWTLDRRLTGRGPFAYNNATRSLTPRLPFTIAVCNALDNATHDAYVRRSTSHCPDPTYLPHTHTHTHASPTHLSRFFRSRDASTRFTNG